MTAHKQNAQKRTNAAIAWTKTPSSRGQQRTTLDLPGAPVVVSSAITTGVLALQYPVSGAGVPSFVTRYQGIFQEFRIESARFEVIPLSPTQFGSAMVWWEENTNVPTLTEAQTRTGEFIPVNGAAASKFSYQWNSRDFTEESWVPIDATNAAYVFAQFTMYSNTPNYGNSAAGYQTFCVRPVFRVAFRGLASL